MKNATRNFQKRNIPDLITLKVSRLSQPFLTIWVPKPLGKKQLMFFQNFKKCAIGTDFWFDLFFVEFSHNLKPRLKGETRTFSSVSIWVAKIPCFGSQTDRFLPSNGFYLQWLGPGYLNSRRLRKIQSISSFSENHPDPETTRFSKKSLSFLSTNHLDTKSMFFSPISSHGKSFSFFYPIHQPESRHTDFECSVASLKCFSRISFWGLRTGYYNINCGT